MSFGGGAALSAQKELEKEKELELAMTGVNLSSDEDCDREMSIDVISIASSAAVMERKPLENRVIQLEMQLQTAHVATAVTNRNQAIHTQVLQDTAVMATAIMEMDNFTLWWMTQWIEESKASIAAADAAGNVGRASRLRSYKEWVYKNGKKAEAGMTHNRNAPPTVPNTPTVLNTPS